MPLARYSAHEYVEVYGARHQEIQVNDDAVKHADRWQGETLKVGSTDVDTQDLSSDEKRIGSDSSQSSPLQIKELFARVSIGL